MRFFLVVGLICQLRRRLCDGDDAGFRRAPAATSPSQAANAIGDIVRDEIAAGKVPGAVVVLGINDRIVLREAYGNRSVMPSVQPTTLDTVYDAASLTKVMATSVAIMQLVERGQIDLDRPAAYWPAFAANGKGDITVRQLMTHYAALPAGITHARLVGHRGRARRDCRAEAAGTRRHALRAQRRRFHRAGRDRAARLGQPLDAYAAKNIFQPLGMRDTSFGPAAPRRAASRRPKSTRRRASRCGVLSTTPQLATWAALRDTRVSSPLRTISPSTRR